IATPARLACVKPAASVRSEPGSNSQVGLETLNRLITTFDEVPPFFVSRSRHAACDSHRGQRWCNLFKTCTAEVFRPISKDENRSFQVFEIRKDYAVHVSLSTPSLVKQPGAETPLPITGVFSRKPPKGPFRILTRRQMTTDGYRLLSHSS